MKNGACSYCFAYHSGEDCLTLKDCRLAPIVDSAKIQINPPAIEAPLMAPFGPPLDTDRFEVVDILLPAAKAPFTESARQRSFLSTNLSHGMAEPLQFWPCAANKARNSNTTETFSIQSRIGGFDRYGDEMRQNSVQKDEPLTCKGFSREDEDKECKQPGRNESEQLPMMEVKNEKPISEFCADRCKLQPDDEEFAAAKVLLDLQMGEQERRLDRAVK